MVRFRVFHIYDSFPDDKRDVFYGLIRRLCLQQGEHVRRDITSSKGQEVVTSSKGQEARSKKSGSKSKKKRKKNFEACNLALELVYITSSKGQDGMQFGARQWQPHRPGPPRPSGYSID